MSSESPCSVVGFEGSTRRWCETHERYVLFGSQPWCVPTDVRSLTVHEAKVWAVLQVHEGCSTQNCATVMALEAVEGR